MTVEELSTVIKNNGIVGAGGAGFPTYMKIDKRADTILLNCAECEPLLKLHRQLLTEHAGKIVETFSLIADTVGAKDAVIGIKEEYHNTILALEDCLMRFPKVRIHRLHGSYPMGDEVVLIYEALGEVISPGSLPIEAGVAVFNVETVYNIFRALQEGTPVADKLVTVVGEVEAPITVRVPIGTSLKDTVALAGKETVEDAVYLVGGPMMGKIGSRYDAVTKTTNAILVLSKEHLIIQKKQLPPSLGMKRAASACCQCQMCTDLCPRFNLGHPIEPHRFMQAAGNHNFQDPEVFLNLFFCSGCGLCELFSCPQGLSPRTLIAECKEGLRCAGIKPPKGTETRSIKASREYRRVPEKRLEARLGLSKYEAKAPLDDKVRHIYKVRIYFSQHVGAPAVCAVAKGETVVRGQMVAQAADGLSVPVHASVDGVVTDVTDKYVEIVSPH